MRKGLDKIRNILLYAGLKKDEYDSIQNNLIKMNQANIKILAIITMIVMLIMIACSFQSKVWTADRMIYFSCFFISTGIMIVILLGLLKSETATLIVVYLYLATIFLYGIAIGSTQPSQTSVSFLIFIMVGPLLFYDRPIKINAFIWIFNILFLYNSIKIKSLEARDTDIINGIIFGFVSCFLNTSAVMFKIKRVWMEREMAVMAQTDSLTNLKNRNCFEHHYKDYVNQAKKNVTCIYIDANGLHKLNNLQGHEAGDKMLRYLAEQIIFLFGKEDAYRVGGDEYMVFCCDTEMSLINQKMEELSKRMEDRHYSVSVGIVSAPREELTMDDLIKKADEAMYLSKKKYYNQDGFNRRKNRTLV